MAVSRLYLGVHYPSDIVAGAALGARDRERGHEGRHRRHAQRGQVLAVQRADAAGAEAANYPFTTIEPNVAVVRVHDERLDRSPRPSAPRRSSRTRSTSTTSPAWSRARSKGEGLGNKFLANIRETDAIVHVVRAHHDANVIHPEGSVDPLRDIETIETELIYADLEQAERRHERVVRDGPRRRQGGDRRGGVAAGGRSRRCRRASRSARVPVPEAAPNAVRDLSPLTAKPVLFVANVDEGDDAVPAGDRRRTPQSQGAARGRRSPRGSRPS